MDNTEDKKYMRAALELAKHSYDEGEVPVGAVIVKDGEIIACGRNRREKGKNALYHAEIEAINEACRALGGWRLFQCDIYVTLEPCPMCAGAIINSRLRRLVYGAKDEKAGSAQSVINLFDLPYNHKPQITSGVMEDECRNILSSFFKELRTEKLQKRNIEYSKEK